MPIQSWFALGMLCVAAPCFAAEECGYVDLRPRLGAPLHQGDSSYCFAHSSATLIEARTGFRASPMALAVGFLLTNPEELSGAADPAVQAKLTPGFFSAWSRDRNLEPGNYSAENILTEKGLLDTGGEEVPTMIAADFLGLCPEARLPTGKNVYKAYLKSIRDYHAWRAKSGMLRDDRNSAIGEVTDPEARAKAWSYRRWVEGRCGTTVRPPVSLVPASMSLAKNLKEFRLQQSLQLAISLREGHSRLMKAVNRQLDRGNPVAVGYAISDIIPDGNSAPSVSSEPAAEDHASVFAGRRLENGRCYYYLRNSFGTESTGYLPKIGARYENGGVWVLPEEIPSLYSAVWLE